MSTCRPFLFPLHKYTSCCLLPKSLHKIIIRLSASSTLPLPSSWSVDLEYTYQVAVILLALSAALHYPVLAPAACKKKVHDTLLIKFLKINQRAERL